MDKYKKSNRLHIPKRTRLRLSFRTHMHNLIAKLISKRVSKQATIYPFTHIGPEGIKSTDTYWYDENDNRWTLELYNKSTIVKLSNSLQGCTNCIDCGDCKGCVSCIDCADCKNCINCSYCSRCENCKNCWNVDNKY